MAGDWGKPERMWDEYDWERFLQQQDGKTEKYMQLLETYLDDPRRDEIIAREMGWTNCWMRRIGARKLMRFWRKTPPKTTTTRSIDATASAETFQEHGLYRAAFDLTSGSINCSIRMLRFRTSQQP